MEDIFLWNHHPNLSAPPKRKVCIFTEYNGSLIDQYGIYELENKKYVVLHFCGTQEDLSLGFTEIEEFETQEEAVNFYKENFTMENS